MRWFRGNKGLHKGEVSGMWKSSLVSMIFPLPMIQDTCLFMKTRITISLSYPHTTPRGQNTFTYRLTYHFKWGGSDATIWSVKACVAMISCDVCLQYNTMATRDEKVDDDEAT